jgi:hypothetical protein
MNGFPETQDRRLVRVNARRCPLCRPYFSTGVVIGFVLGIVGMMVAANVIWR